MPRFSNCRDSLSTRLLVYRLVEISEISGKNLFVAESGIKNQSDIDALKEHDINVFLIGESLMKGDFV